MISWWKRTNILERNISKLYVIYLFVYIYITNVYKTNMNNRLCTNAFKQIHKQITLTQIHRLIPTWNNTYRHQIKRSPIQFPSSFRRAHSSTSTPSTNTSSSPLSQSSYSTSISAQTSQPRAHAVFTENDKQILKTLQQIKHPGKK
jgi:hypothetical protein